MTIKEAIINVIQLKNLSQTCSYEVAMEIMDGTVTAAQIAALLVALRIKGESVDEITGFVRAMREKVTRVVCNTGEVIDTCGTGGDCAGTFNISTVAAFVAAGAGCRVAKHGNRSVSSTCGSADLLENLGINIELPPEKMALCIEEVGIGFLFAPLLHRAMKYALPVRREIGTRTIFNILGPLTNPAGTRRQLLGVFNRELTYPLALVLKEVGCEHAMVVHGEDGLDEITVTGRTFVSELKSGKVRSYTIGPEDFGIKRGTLDELRVKDVEENVQSALGVLNMQGGTRQDIVVFNAGAAIYVAGIAQDIEEGIEKARESINSGNAFRRLELLQEIAR